MDSATRISNVNVEDLSEAVTFPVEAYISREYAAEEMDKLWSKVWQHAGRVEEIPNVGDFITYEIARESFIIIRTAPDTIKAYYNVCPHRGRRLIDTEGNGTHGNKQRIVCGFHGWTFNTDGKNTFILDPQDWKGALSDACRTGLTEVKVDTWGGWLYINMDPNCESLESFLGDAGRILAPFEFEKMRYKWRQYVVYPANWKTSLEAFMEPYHVAGTHTQLLKYGNFYAYSKAYGLHGVSGFDERDPALRKQGGTSVVRAGGGEGVDPRVSTYALARENYETVNFAGSTETLLNAAKRLVDELPEGTTAPEVIKHWMTQARADDAARGVIWPSLTPEQQSEAGLAWSVFPNQSIMQGVTFALCYRSRPHEDDPNWCVFEAYALERFPEGQEPKTEWVNAEPTAENWGLVLSQDFANMKWVQKGQHSRGFRGPLPNPHQERKVTNFHRNLANYMGRGGLSVLDK